MNQHQALSVVLPGVGNLDAYIRVAYQAPMLEPEEERSLAERWFNEQDVDAARQLVLSHVRYVIHIVRQYQNFGMPQGDLIQEGTLGLMKAVKRFDPNKGVRLASFAIHWIKSEIHEYILKNWRIVKVATTKAQRKLFFNLHKHLSHQTASLSDDTIDHIAETLDVRQQDVRLMETRLRGQDTAFDGEPGEEDAPVRSPAKLLGTQDFDPADMLEAQDWQDKRLGLLQRAMDQLSERDRYIVQSRWIDQPKATLQALADVLDLSPERVRQLEKKAIAKLSSMMQGQHLSSLES